MTGNNQNVTFTEQIFLLYLEKMQKILDFKFYNLFCFYK